jgi:hypothetical protein
MFPKRYLGIIPSYSVPLKKKKKKRKKREKKRVRKKNESENKRTRVLIMRFSATQVLSKFFKVQERYRFP